MKFVVTATPGTSELDIFLQGVYELYSDYVLKVIITFIKSLKKYIFDCCFENL